MARVQEILRQKALYEGTDKDKTNQDPRPVDV